MVNQDFNKRALSISWVFYKRPICLRCRKCYPFRNLTKRCLLNGYEFKAGSTFSRAHHIGAFQPFVDSGVFWRLGRCENFSQFQRRDSFKTDVHSGKRRWLAAKFPCSVPKQSMYGIFPYVYHKNQPNVGKYTVPYMDGMGYDIHPRKLT